MAVKKAGTISMFVKRIQLIETLIIGACLFVATFLFFFILFSILTPGNPITNSLLVSVFFGLLTATVSVVIWPFLTLITRVVATKQKFVLHFLLVFFIVLLILLGYGVPVVQWFSASAYTVIADLLIITLFSIPLALSIAVGSIMARKIIHKSSNTASGLSH